MTWPTWQAPQNQSRRRFTTNTRREHPESRKRLKKKHRERQHIFSECEKQSNLSLYHLELRRECRHSRKLKLLKNGVLYKLHRRHKIRCDCSRCYLGLLFLFCYSFQAFGDVRSPRSTVLSPFRPNIMYFR